MLLILDKIDSYFMFYLHGNLNKQNHIIITIDILCFTYLHRNLNKPYKNYKISMVSEMNNNDTFAQQ